MKLDDSIKTIKKTAHKKINAPFGYFGSKNKIALQLCTELPPHNCWVEVFCGSAALTLNKAPSPIEVINDIDGDITNFFEQLRDNSDALQRAVELTPYAEEELILARVSAPNLSNLERARRFLVQSMMAINGVFGKEKGGFSYSDSYSRQGHDARVNRWNNLPDRLVVVAKRLKSVRVEKKDARRIVKRYLYRPATLLYIDPPYFGDRTHGYSNDANNEDFHKELLDLVCKAKCMVFISGYGSELYDNILTANSGWSKREIETTTKDTKGNSHSRTEVVWMNKHFTKALMDKKVPITLTDIEKKRGKLNPERAPKKKQH
ncbi:MAG: DNA adenine methylase [Bacteroidetes bacterium]|nr:DNA adenine methylase [Bacteroidota bacterium]